ncbi:hypothetical protein [Phreatobacter aquaticus]|uniref:hypothetical protein n=1 Tax=Phreatobacter aquaticus TaxID=2570229 RepID=UPI00208FD710|nr:hypothetical protein [Phreatobacter aquaticus]
MGQALPSPDPASARFFVVCPSAGGLWIARESQGLAEGVFRTRQEAVRFALAEGGRDNVVRFSASPALPSYLTPLP